MDNEQEDQFEISPDSPTTLQKRPSLRAESHISHHFRHDSHHSPKDDKVGNDSPVHQTTSRGYGQKNLPNSKKDSGHSRTRSKTA